MARSYFDSLVATVGVEAAASRLLNERSWDRDAEEAFAANVDRIPWDCLFAWLTLDVPDGMQRSPARAVARIVASLPVDDGFIALDLPDRLRRIHCSDTRDELVEQLRARMTPESWSRCAYVVSGGDMFVAFRDKEAELLASTGTVPGIVYREGTFPALMPQVFDARRSDADLLAAFAHAVADERTRFYALWILDQLSLLARVGTLDILGAVPSFHEVKVDEYARVGFLMTLARRWPSEEYRRWAIDRALAARARGVPWSSLYWEIDPAHRDDVALASIDTSSPAPWALAALSRGRLDLAAWGHALAFAESRASDDRDASRVGAASRAAEHAFGTKIAHGDVETAHQEFDPRNIGPLLFEMPLPANAHEEFDGRYVRALERLDVLPGEAIARRLLTLPLTRDRARRVIALTGPREFWSIPSVVDVARAAGLAPDEVPPPAPLTPATLAAFRALAGARADEWIALEFDNATRRCEVDTALHLVSLAPELAASAPRRDALRTVAISCSIGRLDAFQSANPWLIEESEVLAAALNDPDDRRLRTWRPVDKLRPYLRPAIEAKAVTTTEVSLACELLERLEALGSSRREILALSRERVSRHGFAALPEEWLARKLDSKSIWNDVGGEIVEGALVTMGADAINFVDELLFQASYVHRDGKPDLDPALHAALGNALLRIAEDALDAANVDLARRALTGLALLNAPSRFRDRVRALRRRAACANEVLSEIEVNEMILRRPTRGEAATAIAMRRALRALTSTTHETTDADGDDQ